MSDLVISGIAKYEKNTANTGGVDRKIHQLLQTTIVAIIDSGVTPETLRNTKTGVFLGYVQNEKISSVESLTSPSSSEIANQVSHQLGLIGPSVALNLFNNSSLLVFDVAIKSISADECDAALIIAFDEDQEDNTSFKTIAAIFMQNQKFANRVYVNLIHSDTDFEHCEDDLKEIVKNQTKFLTSFYKKINVDPEKWMSCMMDQIIMLKL